MTEEILDLDKLLPEPKKIILGGKEWKLSAEIPVKDILKLLKFYKKIGTQEQTPEVLVEVLDLIYGFFSEHHPELSRDEFEKRLRITQLPALVAFLFEGIIDKQKGKESKKDQPESQEKEAPLE